MSKSNGGDQAGMGLGGGSLVWPESCLIGWGWLMDQPYINWETVVDYRPRFIS